MGFRLPPLDLQVKVSRLPEPKMEYRFHPERLWRIDYCWPDYKLAVEIEGGAWLQGRHTRGKGFVDDMEKYNEMAIEGYSLLRFTPEDISNGNAIAVISRWFDKKMKR